MSTTHKISRSVYFENKQNLEKHNRVLKWKRSTNHNFFQSVLLQPANEVWGKVIFSQASVVILSTGVGGVWI